jgi:hypothetical protein
MLPLLIASNRPNLVGVLTRRQAAAARTRRRGPRRRRSQSPLESTPVKAGKQGELRDSVLKFARIILDKQSGSDSYRPVTGSNEQGSIFAEQGPEIGLSG